METHHSSAAATADPNLTHKLHSAHFNIQPTLAILVEHADLHLCATLHVNFFLGLVEHPLAHYKGSLQSDIQQY